MRAAPVPAPLDVRWVPALLLCLGLGAALPGQDSRAVAAISGACLLAALAGGVGLLAAARRRRPCVPPGRPPAARGPLTALVLAGVAGALFTQHAALDQGSRERVGWADVVAAEQSVRIQVRLGGPAQASAARFGPRWTAPVEVFAFGHPVRPLERVEPARLTGDGEGPAALGAVSAGGMVCVVAVPRREGDTVFLATRADPVPGPCSGGGTEAPPSGTTGSSGPTGASGPTGRDRLRGAFRDLAAPTVGTAPELIPGLVLGDRSVQSPELGAAMTDAGLSHLSAVSGANCALLVGAVTVVLRSLRVHRHAVVAAALGTLGVFVVIVGPEPSVLRAAVMGGLGATAVFLGRGRQAFSLLGVGGTLLLVAVPTLAGEVAFHLSLAATAGIVLGAAPADRWMHPRLGRILPDSVARWLSASLAVTVAAHLACQPLLLAMTGTVSTYAVLTNLVAAPAVAPVTVLGTVAAAAALPAPPVAAALLAVAQWPAAFIGLTATTAAALPGALRPWPGGAVGLGLGVLLTVATLAGFRAVLVAERQAPARVRRVGRSAPERRVRVSAVAVLTAALVASATGAVGAVLVPRPAGSVPPGWTAAFCDVGQGDMSVFRTAERAALVVDVGPDPEAARRCLADLQVERVDAVLLTHLHADHAGGLAGLTGSTTPAAVRYASRAESEPAASASSASSPRASPGAAQDPRPRAAGGEDPALPPPPGAERLATGESGSAGDVEWTVLLADAAAAEENDASAQLLVTVAGPAGAATTLVTGDMEEASSAAWAAGRRSDASPPPPVDVLKVAHHGARNGGADVPAAVRARLQVISVGADNTYGHPHPATVQALERLGPVARTDLHGTMALTLEPQAGGAGGADAADAPGTALAVHTVRPPERPAGTP